MNKTETWDYKSSSDENVRKILLGEVFDKDSVIRLNASDVDRFLSHQGKLVRVKSSGNDEDTIKAAFEDVKFKNRGAYDAECLLVILVFSRIIDFEKQMTAMKELETQFGKCSSDTAIQWALTIKDQSEPICLVVNAIFQ